MSYKNRVFYALLCLFLREGRSVNRFWLPENGGSRHGSSKRPQRAFFVIRKLTFWDALRRSEKLWNALRRSEALWDALKRSETLWNTLRRAETFWDALRSSETLWVICPSSKVGESWFPHLFISEKGTYIKLKSEKIDVCGGDRLVGVRASVICPSSKVWGSWFPP